MPKRKAKKTKKTSLSPDVPWAKLLGLADNDATVLAQALNDLFGLPRSKTKKVFHDQDCPLSAKGDALKVVKLLGHECTCTIPSHWEI